MKPSELEFGDWMCRETSTDHEADKILFLDRYVHFPFGYRQYEADPVPLREDMLYKNGWKRSTPFLWKHKECPFELLINFGDGRLFIDGNGVPAFDFRYVHQLQHALRLTGNKKLANSFMV